MPQCPIAGDANVVRGSLKVIGYSGRERERATIMTKKPGNQEK